jgi:hypothetical protein
MEPIMAEETELSEQDEQAIRALLLKAFAALPPEAREFVLIGGDEDADADDRSQAA